jgi:SRSO17 transposase
MTRVGARFRRVEPRRRARALVVGLLAGLPRKNCWTIAEHAGDATPDGMQHLLARAKWDADGVRDDVRGYVAEHLGDPRAVLVVDETGDLKKKAPPPSACSGSTPAPPGGSRTRRSPSTSGTRPGAGTR